MRGSDTTLETIQRLVSQGAWLVSDHAMKRIDERSLVVTEIAVGLASAEVIEEYPNDPRGQSVLLLYFDGAGPMHALWGVKAGTTGPAILITAYRPDPLLWLNDNRTRRP